MINYIRYLGSYNILKSVSEAMIYPPPAPQPIYRLLDFFSLSVTELGMYTSTSTSKYL